jgi:hypothetical protein
MNSYLFPIDLEQLAGSQRMGRARAEFCVILFPTPRQAAFCRRFVSDLLPVYIFPDAGKNSKRVLWKETLSENTFTFPWEDVEREVLGTPFLRSKSGVFFLR